MKQNNIITNIDGIIFSVFCGIIATVWNYYYGFGNQIEQLPIVKRAIDSSYLVNDFFTNTTSGFGPRYYFVNIVAWLNNFFSVPLIYFFFTLISNILISTISYFYSREIFNNSILAGILASIFVMSLSVVGIGSVSALFQNALTPFSIAFPLILLSFLSVIRGYPILIGVFAGIASIIHPLIGLGSGGILLLSCFILNIFENKRLLQDYFQILIGSLILICFSLITLIPYHYASIEQISSYEFINIVAYFRHPRHYIPSEILTFRSTFGAMTFFGATAITWYLWQRKPDTNKHQAYYILIVTIVIFILCIGGYIFVELIPSRLWVTAQTFRFLDIIKWIGLILFAGYIASALSESKDKIYGYLLSISVLSPITMFIALSSTQLGKFFKNKKFLLSVLRYCMVPWLILVLVVSYLSATPTNIYMFLFCLFLILTVQHISRKIFYSIIVTTLIFILVNTIYLPEIDLPSKFESKLSKLFRPKIHLSDYSGDNIEIAKYIKQMTPKNAIFLTPPAFGELRLIGERAIVIDFKAFVFHEPEMIQWKERLLDCYGVPKYSGVDAEREFDNNYKTIKDSQIKYLRTKYNISYAILYKQTKTSFSIIDENFTYKLVELK